MADVKRLNTRPKFQRFRERRLSLSNEGPEAPSTLSQQNEQVKVLVENFSKIEGKAEAIRLDARKLAITRHVPVEDRAVDVRAAVVRQDPGSSGAFISFELYERSLTYLNQQRESLPVEILDSLSGDPITDSHRVHTTILAEIEDISIDEAELLASQIVILFVLKLLQMGLDNLDTGKQTAGKAPSGTELASIAAGIAISIAAQQAYAGIQAKQIEQSLKEISGKIPNDQINVEAAKKELANSGLFQAALQSRRPSDFALIVQYVDAFLNRQTEPGWETWQVMGMLVESTSWIRSTVPQLQRYHNPQLSEQQSPKILNPLLTQSILFQTTTNKTAVQLDNNVLRVYNKSLDSINRTVDKIGQVLGGGLAALDVCCLLRWLELQGTGIPETIKTVLEVTQNTLETLDNLGAANSFRAQLTVSAAIHQSVMLLMNDLEQGLLKKIEEWFLTNDSAWEELMKCQLLDELYTYLVQGIDKIRDKLTTLLDRYLGYIEDQEKWIDTSIDTVGNQLELRRIISIIDQFLSFTGPAGGVCSEEPDPEKLAQSADRVVKGLGPSIVIPLNGNPYSTVASGPVKLSSGFLIPHPSTVPETETTLEAAQHVCRSGIVDMNLVPFPRG